MFLFVFLALEPFGRIFTAR